MEYHWFRGQYGAFAGADGRYRQPPCHGNRHARRHHDFDGRQSRDHHDPDRVWRWRRPGQAYLANYLYQVAVNIALTCEDRDETDNKWMLSRMTHDWARFQAGTNLAKWAVVNYEFSLSLSRELGKKNPERFLPEVALCLNNLGAVYFRLGDLKACEAAFQEAVEIRRARPVNSERYQENLGHSLMNLGMVARARGSLETARECYEESIRVTAERLATEPSAIVDLAHRQIHLAHCLGAMPGAEADAEDAVEAAKETLPKVAEINPEAAREFEAVLRHGPDNG